MTTPPVDIKNAQMQAQTQQLQFQQRQIGSLANGGKARMSEEQKEKKLRESCEGFESIFIQKMWQQMRATLPKNNLLQGKEEQFWQGMYDQELSKKMASAGGIGLADMMYEQLSRTLVSASRTTASAVSASASGTSNFVAAAAPLLPPTAETATATGKAAGKGSAHAGARPSDMYAGAAAQPEAPGESTAALAPGQANQVGQPGQAAQATQPAPAPGAPAEAAPEASPVVQQFLAQLRQQQTQQHGQNAEAQTVAVHSVQHGQGGMTLAQRAQLDAANKPPSGGVMPSQRSQRLTPPAARPAQAQAAQAPAVQAAVAQPQADKVQAPAAQAAAGQTAPAAAAPQAASLPASPVLAEAQAFAAQATAPVSTAAAPAEAQPQVVNTTFTTNVPSKKSRTNRPRGQRLPSGQPIIRTLGAAPASPITSNGNQTGRVTEAPQAPQAAQAPQTPQTPLTAQPVVQSVQAVPSPQAAMSPRGVTVPDVVIPTVNAAMPLSSGQG